MKIAVGSDHAGFELKEYIKEILPAGEYQVTDVGTHSPESVDYPDFGFDVARRVAAGEADRGILVCGTGIGMSIAANKVKGIRAALVNDLYTAAQSRRHNDANVLVLAGRIIGKGLAEEIVKTWLSTEFEGGRHLGRLRKIEAFEKNTDR
ncbi:MAG: putative sugar phosphate isomerase YwlF [Syntrophorhabdus sp. PtaB.Bin047]|jgi:ribose 5-phosphate isomerase B|nr:MAG: putative sugar phosphate isomerase YwlF [Syntrophorhabdus sp. PtaB.Bin047]